MSALDYPELQGMPEGCTTNPPWRIDPVPVAAAYNGQAYPEGVVMLDPLIDIDALSDKAYDLFAGEDNYDLDVPGVTLGYQTEPEMEGWGLMRANASATKNNTSFYHPDAKARIVDLATEAFDLLNENAAIYDTFAEDVEVPLHPKFETSAPGHYPLAREDSVIDNDIDPDFVDEVIAERQAARLQIRENYRKAVYLLWCAMYGAAQSMSFHRNRTIFYEEQGGSNGGMTIDPPPTNTGRQPLYGDDDVELDSIPADPFDPDPFPPQTGRQPLHGGTPPPPPMTGPFDEEEPPLEEAPTTKRKSGGGGMAAAAVVVLLGALALLGSGKR